MANSFSTATLIERVRQRTETEHSDFVTDDEITNYLNDSMKSYYDFMVTAYQDYFIDGYTFSTVSGQLAYALPSDFYKLRGVDVFIDTDTVVSATPLPFAERNKYRQGSWGWNMRSSIRYTLSGSYINLYPVPESVYSVTLWYVKLPPTIPTVRVGGTTDFTGPWDTFIVLDTAITIRDKEESDVSVLMKQRDELKISIIQNAANRDAALPATVANVRKSKWRF